MGKIGENWIATVLIEESKKAKNEARKNALLKITKEIIKRKSGDGIVLFPAGFFSTGKRKVTKASYYPFIESTIRTLKKHKSRNIDACLGIDGNFINGQAKDQIAIAFNSTGLIAAGRKFNPIFNEKAIINLAESFNCKEEGLPRIFNFKGKKIYLSVCYDVFGIKHKNISNPGVNFTANLIHKFSSRCKCEGDTCTCQAASGDVYWVKHGLIGASKQWESRVFASTFFINRKIPVRWPSGVNWNQGTMHQRYWKYSDNPVEALEEITIGNALVRFFKI